MRLRSTNKGKNQIRVKIALISHKTLISAIGNVINFDDDAVRVFKTPVLEGEEGQWVLMDEICKELVVHLTYLSSLKKMLDQQLQEFFHSSSFFKQK